MAVTHIAFFDPFAKGGASASATESSLERAVDDTAKGAAFRAAGFGSGGTQGTMPRSRGS
jgi:hypothetical protein